MFLTCRHDCLLDFAANIAKKNVTQSENITFFVFFVNVCVIFYPKSLFNKYYLLTLQAETIMSNE